MDKKYVLINLKTNQYFTGIYWYENEIWNSNYKDAKLYNNKNEIKNDFNDENYKESFENVNFLKIETLFINE